MAALSLTIHRGAHQVGGCCTEISTGKTRIVIDIGQELPGPGVTPKPLRIDGVTCGTPNCDGVFFTHYHGDHVGHYTDVLPGIPLYMGKASKEIFQVLQTHRAVKDEGIRESLPALEAIRTFEAKDPVTVGDIQVTPFFTDHSAYDAYLFLIEAEDKRILHTGDFRMHGFLGKGVLSMLENHVRQVDLLITEGTTLSRPDIQPETEHDLQARLRQYARKYKYIFLLCSSTHIDRLASAHAVAKERHIPFVCDRYQKDVLDVVTRHTGGKHPLYNFDRVLTYGKNLDAWMEQRGFIMAIRGNEKYYPLLDKYQGPESIVLYSMWKSYLEQNGSIARMVEGRRWEYLHTSGHASPAQIKAVCDQVRPRIGVIPIHTDAPEKLGEVCPGWGILHLKDGERIEI